MGSMRLTASKEIRNKHRASEEQGEDNTDDKHIFLVWEMDKMRITSQQSVWVRPCKRHESIDDDLPTLKENKKEARPSLDEKLL